MKKQEGIKGGKNSLKRTRSRRGRTVAVIERTTTPKQNIRETGEIADLPFYSNYL